ncbi:retrotransposon protein, putative, unclassified [Fagus crenata]
MVEVWNDRWTPYPLSRRVASTEVQYVVELIDSKRGTWDEMIVDRVFKAHSKVLVKQTLLHLGQGRDKVRWIHDKKGEFSVRSAYNIAVRTVYGCHGEEASNASDLQRFWKQLWKSKAPGKTKHLVWRACQNILPTHVNLLHRNILSTAKCLVYKQKDEDMSHALWGCPYARDVWSLASPRLQKSVCSMDDFRHVAQYIFVRLMPIERTQWMSIT